MRFEPRQPRDGVNVSREHPAKEAVLLILGLGFVLALVFGLLLCFVDIAVALIPVHAEARAFSSWNPAALELTEGARIEAVRGLLDRLLVHAPESPYTFRVGLLPSEEPNALALPGGLIMVSDGLLDQIVSENELALVLGHELGHFQDRDHLRGLGRGMVLGIVKAVLIRSHNGLALSELVSELTVRGFGREDERNADRFGLGLVHAEYGHTAGAAAFFERLAARRGGGEDLVAYLSTHPSNAGRVEDLAALAVERGWTQRGETVAFDKPGDEP